MKDTLVVDLDGTLADLGHRLHLVKGPKKDFDTFYSLVGGDGLNEWCEQLMRLFWASGFEVVIVSARRRACDADTRRWLKEFQVRYSSLFLLRPDGDSTPDQELKRAWLKAYGPERILFVVDDRQKVVDMWRSEGMTCLQCAAWQESPSRQIEREDKLK